MEAECLEKIHNELKRHKVQRKLSTMDNLHYRFRAAKHDGRRLQAASERNGRRWSGHFVWRNTTADFELFIASIGMSFVTGNNKGAFRYIMGKFEDFLSISSRENALRVTRLVNMLCRNLLAKI